MSTKVSVLTGGVDSHYAIPLIAALARRGLSVEILGSDEFLGPQEVREANVSFVNVHGNMSSKNPFHKKVLRVLSTYANLGRYAWRTDSTIFHILWHNTFKVFDRIVVTGYYKILGKTLLLTVHNVDIDERDGKSGFVSRTSLRLMYRMIDHLFVHTEKMKTELETDFGVPGHKVTVHPFGMNTVPPNSDLTRAQARDRLGIGCDEKIALFFGNVAPYKGLEYLIQALSIVKREGSHDVRLILAGKIKNREAVSYWEAMSRLITEQGLSDRVRAEIRHIPDEEVEVFMKAADVCVLPYVYIYQTGVLILSYRYGLPAVVTDAGSMRDDVIEGRTGFMCRPRDAADLARALTTYFSSQLFADGEAARHDIVTFAEDKYSWKAIATTVAEVYETVHPARQETARAAG